MALDLVVYVIGFCGYLAPVIRSTRLTDLDGDPAALLPRFNQAIRLHWWSAVAAGAMAGYAVYRLDAVAITVWAVNILLVVGLQYRMTVHRNILWSRMIVRAEQQMLRRMREYRNEYHRRESQ